MSIGIVSNVNLQPAVPKLTKAIGVLNPVLSRRCFRGCGVHINIVEDDVGSVHHVDSPELGLYDVEVTNIDIANIPEHEWHWPAWASRTYGGACGLVSLVPVPDLAITVDATSTMTIDTYVIATENESGSMVLKLDVIIVVPPVFEVFRELQVGQTSVLGIRYTRSVRDSPTTLHSNQCSHH